MKPISPTNCCRRTPSSHEILSSDTVQLLVSPVVELGIVALTNYVLRDLSLESHVQAFANLLNSCLKTPHDNAARLALNVYSTFQLVLKARRRLNRSLLLKALPRIDTAVLGSSATVHEPSFTDWTIIEIIFLQNGNGAGLHPALYRYLYSANLTLAGYISKTSRLRPVLQKHSGERGARDSPGGIMTSCFRHYKVLPPGCKGHSRPPPGRHQGVA
ncbi:hypothetical protein Q9L58_009249 [Maublancomyces gigas]|uniref:Uncharacterized protein n=1 Tax=Discina gigas TaxID=1032678 RepID=A0ABR3G7H0_9PEZI